MKWNDVKGDIKHFKIMAKAFEDDKKERDAIEFWEYVQAYAQAEIDSGSQKQRFYGVQDG